MQGLVWTEVASCCLVRFSLIISHLQRSDVSWSFISIGLYVILHGWHKKNTHMVKLEARPFNLCPTGNSSKQALHAERLGVWYSMAFRQTDVRGPDQPEKMEVHWCILLICFYVSRVSHVMHWRFCCDLNVPRQQYKASIAEKEQEKAALKTSRKGAADGHQAFWMAAWVSSVRCAEMKHVAWKMFFDASTTPCYLFHYYPWIVNALGLQNPTLAWWCGQGSHPPTFRLWKASALPRQRWLCKLCCENSIQRHCLLPGSCHNAIMMIQSDDGQKCGASLGGKYSPDSEF